MDNIDANYIQEFDAEVVKSKKNYVCLDQTAFYPEGGGQPSDTGVLQWNDESSKVEKVVKRGNIVKHVLRNEKPSVGITIHGKIDWDKRYKHMKMHTAQHIISGIVFDKYSARTVCNQIHADFSYVDFHPVVFSDEELKMVEKQVNSIIRQNLPVKIYEEQREILEKHINQHRCNLDLLPKSINRLRIIEIEGFDICPCAGTHVRNTNELSEMSIIRRENKGKDTDRIVYRSTTSK